jgi:hypothetical protein
MLIYSSLLVPDRVNYSSDVYVTSNDSSKVRIPVRATLMSLPIVGEAPKTSISQYLASINYAGELRITSYNTSKADLTDDCTVCRLGLNGVD